MNTYMHCYKNFNLKVNILTVALIDEKLKRKQQKNEIFITLNEKADSLQNCLKDQITIYQ